MGHYLPPGWQKARSELQTLVEKARDDRLWEEIQPFLPARKETFREVYAAYLDTLKPIVRATLPVHPDVLMNFEPICNVIEAPLGTVVNADSFAHVWEKMEEVYMEYEKERVGGFKTRLDRNWIPKDEKAISVLERATAVFYCDQHPNASLIGRSMTQMCHYDPSADPPGWRRWNKVNTQIFDLEGSALAMHLVRLVGLDSLTATAEEMDRLDRRFWNGAWSTKDGYGVYTWRSVVSPIYQFDE